MYSIQTTLSKLTKLNVTTSPTKAGKNARISDRLDIFMPIHLANSRKNGGGVTTIIIKGKRKNIRNIQKK
jgi:hypothetical protein